MRALHVLEVEDDGVLQEREEDEHDAGQDPDLNLALRNKRICMHMLTLTTL